MSRQLRVAQRQQQQQFNSFGQPKIGNSNKGQLNTNNSNNLTIGESKTTATVTNRQRG